MEAETFSLSFNGRQIFVRRWAPAGEASATFQIAHGLGEHGARYARLAQALTGAGYVVYASDHRGHGPTCAPADLGFFADSAGWRAALDDLHVVANEIDRRHAGLPQVFFGHSMGSYLGQTLLAERGERYSAGVLSGSNGPPPALLLSAARLVAGFERWRLGPRGKSALVQQLIFGAQNKPFRPARTPFDWLSRDAAEVDKYVADPLCGFPISSQLALDLTDGLQTLASPALAARIPKTLPLYIFKGGADPVGANLQALVDVYRAAGLKRLAYKVYPDARHEALNETNRDEVTADLLGWLKANVA